MASCVFLLRILTGIRNEGTPDCNLGYYDTFDLLITSINALKGGSVNRRTNLYSIFDIFLIYEVSVHFVRLS